MSLLKFSTRWCRRRPARWPRVATTKLVLELLEDRCVPSTLTFVPDADAYVQLTSPTSTSGTSTHLYTSSSLSSLVHFQVTGVSGIVQSAKLRLYVLDSSVDGPAVYSTGTNWAESTVNWNTRPARTSGILADLGAISSGVWIEYELKAAVTANGTFSFELTSATTDNAMFYSRQGASPPQLVVTFAGTSGPTSPVADAGPDRKANEGSPVTFAGTASGGSAPLSYNWNFGDGTTPVSTLTPTHTFVDNGTYAVTLTVTDAAGLTAQDSAIVSVGNVTPTVNAGPDATLTAGSLLTGSGSFTDPGADTWSATVDYGDGTGGSNLTFNTNKTFSLSHLYPSSGIYTVTVTIRDDDGGVASDTLLAIVNPVGATLPVVNLVAQDANAAEPGNDSGTFTVTRSGDTSAPLTISYSVAGSASAASDYQALPGTLTIPAGSPSATITVLPLDDLLVEGSETVMVTLTSNSAYFIGTAATATVTILDNDVPSTSRTFYVSLLGNDANVGSLAAPWRTIGAAVSKLKPGDMLYVRGGTYYERSTLAVNGTAQAPITIQAYPGETPVIDSGVPDFRVIGNNDWVVDDASLGIYRSVKTYSSLGTLYGFATGIAGYENGIVGLVAYQSEAMFRATTDQYVDSTTPFYVGPGTFRSSDGHIYIRLAKTAEMRYVESRYGTVFSTDLPDPRNYALVLSGASTTMTVTGSYLNFDGLEIHQGSRSVAVKATAHDLVFKNVTVWNGDHGIDISGGHHILITQSRVYGDVPRWIAWSDTKDAPAPADKMRGTDIALYSGAHDVEVSYTHIRGGHDLVGMNNNEYNLTVHHCRLENAQDDAFEIEGTINVGRHDIYENYIGNCLTALSEGQATAHFDGPGFIYRNVVVLLRNPYINRAPGINSWNGGGRYGYEHMFKQSGSGYTTNNVHYYHNTLIMLNSAADGINLTPKDPTNARIANNLVITVNGIVDRFTPTATGLVRDGNLYWSVNNMDAAHLIGSFDTVAALNAATGLEAHGLGSVPKYGTDPLFATFQFNVLDRTKTVWEIAANSEVFQPADFFLSAASPAIGAGIVIPDLPGFGPLPDSRNSRDIGAIPFGASAADYNIFPLRVSLPAPSGSLTASAVLAPVAVNGPVLTVAQVQPLVKVPSLGWQTPSWDSLQIPTRVYNDLPVADLGRTDFNGTAARTLGVDDNAAAWSWFIEVKKRHF